MNKTTSQANHTYLLWPIAVLCLLTFGVFFTTREVPKQQEIRSHAQVEQFDTPTTASPAAELGTISFSLPGIASQEGNVAPLHKTRDVVLFFYDRNSNFANPQVKPLYTFKTTVTFDADPASSTYATFVHKHLSLSPSVPNGTFQVGLKTNQAVLTFFKADNQTALGVPVAVGAGRDFNLSFGRLITGDIAPIPEGNNAVNIEDYNEMMNCFGELLNTSFCTAKAVTDLDDNGVVDGIDYNILLRSLKLLLFYKNTEQTKTNIISPSPTLRPTLPSAKNNITQNTSWSVIIFTCVLIVFAAGFMVLFKHKIPWISLFGNNDKEYFIKQDKNDEEGWFTLADDHGQIRGHYTGGKIHDGFARVKGLMKSDSGKQYMEITKIVWED